MLLLWVVRETSPTGGRRGCRQSLGRGAYKALTEGKFRIVKDRFTARARWRACIPPGPPKGGQAYRINVICRKVPVTSTRPHHISPGGLPLLCCWKRHTHEARQHQFSRILYAIVIIDKIPRFRHSHFRGVFWSSSLKIKGRRHAFRGGIGALSRRPSSDVSRAKHMLRSGNSADQPPFHSSICQRAGMRAIGRESGTCILQCSF